MSDSAVSASAASRSPVLYGFNGTGMKLDDMESQRPDLQLLRKHSRAEIEFFIEWNSSAGDQSPDRDSEIIPPYFRCAHFKEDGSKLFRQRLYLEAIDMYMSAMRVFLGEDAVLPSLHYLNEIYLDCGRGKAKWRATLDLAACANNIAQCYSQLGDLSKMIEWIEEFQIIFNCWRLGTSPNQPTWKDSNLQIVENFTLRIKAQHRACLLFNLLGNTSLAASYEAGAYYYTRIISCATNSERVTELQGQIDFKAVSEWKHPDPNKMKEMEVTRPELQIRGFWKRIIVSKGHRPSQRSSFVSWMWKGRMYIGGGETDCNVDLFDLWYLTFSNMSWHQLPKFPVSEPGLLVRRSMKVWRNKAYLFMGTTKMWAFDLVQEKWSFLPTEFRGQNGQKWPYRGRDVKNYCAEVLENKLYVFGGDDGYNCLGSNVFMVLDLPTLRWEHIGGMSDNVPKVNEPNLRQSACMWADPTQRCLYLLYGCATRTTAKRLQKAHGYDMDYTYEDLWTFDVVTRTWHRERLHGNFPSPRVETATAYNPVLRRTVVYGGYTSGMIMMGAGSDFHYFGDAFVFDPERKMWQMVFAKGFPSYRARATLCSNPDTGETYLFGGYTFSDYGIPSKKAGSHLFGDVWQLKLDMDGGFLDDADLRTESQGSLKMCFTCGSCDFAWKKCAGTCRGNVSFCSTECLEEGWKEHEETHACRKQR